MFKKNYTLKYKLNPDVLKIYKVKSETLYRNPIIEAKNIFQYDIEFKYEKEGSFNSYIIKNNKVNFVNLSEKESLYEKALIEMEEPFSEIVYKISEKGEILEIKNLDILQNKWLNKKIELQKKYINHKNEMEYYIQNVDQVLNNPRLVNDYFQNFGINNILYGGLYGQTYFLNNSKNLKLSIPNFLNFFPLPLKLEIITKNIDEKLDKLDLEIKGNLNPILLDESGIREMFEMNLPKEKIGELEYDIDYSQQISFYMSSGLVKTSDLSIIAQIYNKENQKELFYNELKIKIV